MVAYPLVISFLISISALLLIRRVSFKLGRVAYPRKDRWHLKPTPTLGGVGIFAAFIVSVLVSVYLQDNLIDLIERWNILLAAILMFALGLFDDFHEISPPVKLIGQIIAATLVIFYGDMINFFPWPIANIILTIIWLVGITNAINLLDNMDGLAGGVAFIAASVLSFFFWKAGDIQLLLISISLAGAILGFLLYNFPPAKIFMGDSGSLFLGFLLASLAIARRTQASNVFAIIMVPTLLFILPILDTALVTITRLLRGQSPVQGGTDHTSHRLIAFGLSEKQAVVTLYIVALISGIAAATLEALDYELSLILIPVVLIIMLLITAYLGRLKVVTTTQNTLSNLSRLVVDLTYKRRLFEIGLDLLIIGVSYYLAYWTRYGLDMTNLSMSLFIRSWPIALLSAYLAFYLSGVYKGVWRYIGFNDFLRFALASLGAVIFTVLIIKILYPSQPYTFDIFLLYTVFIFLALAASRSSFRILDRLYDLQKTGVEQQRVLLIGAEDEGEFALRWILRNVDMGYHPVGFIDKDPLKKGRIIHGVSVLGGYDDLEKALIERNVNGVIISNGEEISDNKNVWIVESCQKCGVWVRLLRLDFELID
jgi:UDP-GlcNAc:undecaprenyl-phosphate/decaprenyl-phosphate GlcNAc-1-phosphate transferase